MAQTGQRTAQVGGLRYRKAPAWVSAGKSLRTFARKKPLGAISGVILVVYLFIAAFAQWVAPYDPNEQHSGMTLLGSTGRFWLGTDHIGRDILSRILYGARISITVGLCAVAIGTTGGSALGLISGYIGGKFDLYIQRFVDGWQTFPSLILVLSLVAMLGPSLVNVCIAIGIGSIPGTSRLVRSTVLATKRQDYVLAATSLGAGTPRIMVRHILPNVAAPIIIAASVSLGGAILAESSLSFLGLGVPPPTPTWGSMLSGEGRQYMLVNPMMAIWPGVTIAAVVMSFNLLGDALRDVWDPRLRGSR